MSNKEQCQFSCSFQQIIVEGSVSFILFQEAKILLDLQLQQKLLPHKGKTSTKQDIAAVLGKIVTWLTILIDWQFWLIEDI